ncbi:MAG TPA: TIM barrel protein [Lacunisphaera sp.]|nr:TIM barrel protein [Lacunisphaera sp.]
MPHTYPVVQDLSRRRFLALAGLVPAVALVPALGNRALAAAPVTTPGSAAKIPLGIELYAVRGELTKDLPATLRAVAEIGYTIVEFYAPYFQWTPIYAKEVRQRMDDLGLRCQSTHNHLISFTPGDGLARAIELNQILGTRQLVLSSVGRDPGGADGWRRICEQLSVATTALLPHGLTAGFHNHQTEWAKVDGDLRIMDIIAAQTPKEFVLQLDVGTCLEVGADPVAWIKANPGRIKSVHLKDWAPGKPEDNKGYRVLFGEGVAPWAGIVEAAESVGGVEFYLMEQEGSRYSEFDTARRCFEAWQQFRAKR